MPLYLPIGVEFLSFQACFLFFSLVFFDSLAIAKGTKSTNNNKAMVRSILCRQLNLLAGDCSICGFMGQSFQKKVSFFPFSTKRSKMLVFFHLLTYCAFLTDTKSHTFVGFGVVEACLVYQAATIVSYIRSSNNPIMCPEMNFII